MIKFMIMEGCWTRGTQGELRAYKFKKILIEKLEGEETTW